MQRTSTNVESHLSQLSKSMGYMLHLTRSWSQLCTFNNWRGLGNFSHRIRPFGFDNGEHCSHYHIIIIITITMAAWVYVELILIGETMQIIFNNAKKNLLKFLTRWTVDDSFGKINGGVHVNLFGKLFGVMAIINDAIHNAYCLLIHSIRTVCDE